MHIGIISLCLIIIIIIIIPYPDNISNSNNWCLLNLSAAYIQMSYSLFLSRQQTLWALSILLPREQSDLNFLTGVHMRLAIPLVYFVIYISKMLRFRGSFCFTCLVSSFVCFRSLSSLCFSPRKNSGHSIVFKSPSLWRKKYVIVWSRLLCFLSP